MHCTHSAKAFYSQAMWGLPQCRQGKQRQWSGLSQRSCNSTSGSWSWPGIAYHLSYTQTTAAFQGLRCNLMLFSSLLVSPFSSSLVIAAALTNSGTQWRRCSLHSSLFKWHQNHSRSWILHSSSILPVSCSGRKQQQKRSLNKKFNPAEQWKLQHSSLTLTGSFPKYYFYWTSLFLCQ